MKEKWCEESLNNIPVMGNLIKNNCLEFLHKNDLKAKILINFTHGLGDCIDYSIVIKHLKNACSNLIIDVVTHPGHQWALQGFADNVFTVVKKLNKDYDFVFKEEFVYPKLNPNWGIIDPSFNVPPTKVTYTLLENFKIKPKRELYYCSFNPSDFAKASIDKLHKDVIKNHKYAVINYMGSTNRADKDLTHDEAKQICDILLNQGYLCIIADYFNNCPFANEKDIISINKSHLPWLWRGEPDCGVLYELINRANIFVGIDSGPAHVAIATKTPTYVIWMEKGYHPLVAFNFANNCTHIIPNAFMHCDTFFSKEYKWLNYGIRNDLIRTLNYGIRNDLIRTLNQIKEP